nr:integrase, catalytic region, zinc finger, CCHC-type, peptidase aspartic, catalytic [Tanacetum cinerariifolium]
MNDLLDNNNFFIFDDVNVRISPVSKMPSRKKPRDSMHVHSKSNSNKSFPRTVHKWLPKLQPLAEPVAKWFPRIVQICLWIIDSGCSKHMTGNRALSTNFVEKLLGTVSFGNIDFAVIAGYGDVVIDLLTGDRLLNLYTIALNEVASNSSTCLLAKASSLESWLWHQRLSHLNFATINNLVKNNLVQAGSESRPLLLNKENYVPWSSRLLRYAKSRPNGKLIHNSILNGPYVRKMIPEPGDADRDITVTETFHLQTDDELFDKELKQIEADDQAIQTILLGLPKDIYADEKKDKLFNEWERFTSNEGESIESYYHRFLKLMNDLKRNKHFPKKIASNLKFLNNLQPEWSRHVTIVHQTKDLHTANYTQLYDFLKYNQKEVDELKADRLAKTQDPLALMEKSNNPYAFPAPHQDQSSFNQNYLQQPMPNPKDITDPITAMNMALALMAKAFKLNYSTPTNNNQRISSNPRKKQIAQPGNGNQNQIGNGNLVAARAEGNAAGQNGNQIRCYNCRGIGHYDRNCTVRPRRRDAAYLQTQLLIAQKEEVGIQLQEKEYDLMAPATNLDEIEKVNANCILMANLQQASTSDGSAEVIQICLWCVNSGCSKHMTGNLKLLINFVWKFMGTVNFGNDHVAAILGFGDLQWGNILITRVYFVEGLGHNLFSIGQFCDSDLEVAFRRNACFVRNLEGVELLKGDRSTNLYTINLNEMASASPICLMARTSSTKSWLWHQRKKQKSISSTKTSSKLEAKITSSLYGFVWTNENCQYKWKALVIAKAIPCEKMLEISLQSLLINLNKNSLSLLSANIEDHRQKQPDETNLRKEQHSPS